VAHPQSVSVVYRRGRGAVYYSLYQPVLVVVRERVAPALGLVPVLIIVEADRIESEQLVRRVVLVLVRVLGEPVADGVVAQSERINGIPVLETIAIGVPPVSPRLGV
jgi:hypothetical protein